MSLAQHNHVIQTVSANRTDDAFAIRILPRRTRCGDHFIHAHVVDACPKDVAIDAIAITNQESRRCVVGECLDDLLRRPSCGRMRCDVEMNNAPTAVA